MSMKDVKHAKSTDKKAERFLVAADDLGKSSLPNAQRKARAERRAAKRLKSKAVRRQGKLLCNLGDVDVEEVEQEEERGSSRKRD